MPLLALLQASRFGPLITAKQTSASTRGTRCASVAVRHTTRPPLCLPDGCRRPLLQTCTCLPWCPAAPSLLDLKPNLLLLQILGNAINGCAGSGTTGAVGFFYGSKPSPAWDANQVGAGEGQALCWKRKAGWELSLAALLHLQHRPSKRPGCHLDAHQPVLRRHKTKVESFTQYHEIPCSTTMPAPAPPAPTPHQPHPTPPTSTHIPRSSTLAP